MAHRAIKQNVTIYRHHKSSMICNLLRGICLKYLIITTISIDDKKKIHWCSSIKSQQPNANIEIFTHQTSVLEKTYATTITLNKH